MYYYLQDRAKIQTRRRPPSRQLRKAAAARSSGGLSDELFDPQSPTSPTTSSVPPLSSPSGLNSPPRVPSPDLSDSSKVRPKTDLFGNEDLFSSDLPKSSAKFVIERSNKDTSESSSGDIFADNKFSDISAKKTSKTENFDDLFSGPSKTKSKSNSLHADDTDIFDSVPKKSDSKSEHLLSPNKANDDILSVKTSKPKSKTAAISEDDEDLFSSPSLSGKTKDKKPKAALTDIKDKIEENGLPEGGKGKNPKITEEDDIFASSSLNKKKGKPCLKTFAVAALKKKTFLAHQIGVSTVFTYVRKIQNSNSHISYLHVGKINI